MKNLLVVLLMTVSSIAFAGPHHGHHGHHRHWNPNSWIIPALIGGAVVYATTRHDPVVIQQPTVVLQPNQVMIDGVIYNKQIMIINGVQTEVLVRTF